MTNRFPQAAARALLLAVLYFVTGRLGLMFPAYGSHITLLWLPTGIAVAALMRCGFGCWPGVSLGALAVSLTTGVVWPAALGIAVGNTAGPLLAAWILRRAGLHPAFDRRRDILLLAEAAVLGMLVSASLGVATLALSGDLLGGWTAAWLTWWAGDIMGVIAGAPLVFACTRQEWRLIVFRRGEFVIWIGTTILIGFGVFVLNQSPDGHPWALAFLPLPLLAWAALRFEAIGTSLAVIILSAGAAFGTAMGLGPFHRDVPTESGVMLWLFMATTAALGWLITALHAGRLKAVGMQRLFDQALSEISFGVLITDLDRKVLYANEGFTRLTGYTEPEVLGKDWRVLQGPGSDPAVVEKISAALRGDGCFDGEVLSFRKDGTSFWNGLLISPVHNEHDERTGFLAILRNVSERRETETALDTSVEFSSRLIDAMQDGFSLLDTNGVLVDANPALCRMTGFSREELVGRSPPFPYWAPEEQERVHAGVRETLKGRFNTRELMFVRKNGERFPVIVSPSAIKNKEGVPVNFLATIKDITERKQAEEALLTASQKLKLHFEQTPMAVIEWDLEFRVTQWNPAAQTIFGFSRDEAFGQHASFIIPERYRSHVDEVWQALLRNTGGERSSNENTTKDGRTVLCEWYNTRLVDARGTVVGVASLVVDITERRQADQALLESELKFRTLFENGGDAIFLMQGEMFVDCNVRTLEMFGCQARGQIVGHPPYEFSPRLQPNGRESHEYAIEKISAALAGRPQFFEWMHTKLDGTAFPAEVTLNAVVLGGHVMVQAIVRDISERKRAEEAIRTLNADLERRVEQRTSELQAANKELEAFSYSVSHDLKAPLRAVEGFSRIVAKNYAERLDDEGRRMLDMILNGSRQMGRLIDDLLAFSRLGRQPLEHKPIDMHALAQLVFNGLAALEPARELRLDLRPLPPARGTQAMIRQVWANLIGNAVKFTKKREVAEIEIGAKDCQGGETIYYVKDNGAGFEMRHAQRLFGVFQRLHSVDEFEGTGIGLALVQRVVQRHAGRIWAEAEVDRGATFFFTLPGAKNQENDGAKP